MNTDSSNVTKSFVIDFAKDFVKKLTNRQKVILEMIADNPSLTAKAISEKISEKASVSYRTIQNDLAQLKKIGILIRKGGRKDGEWIIIGSTETNLFKGTGI